MTNYLTLANKIRELTAQDQIRESLDYLLNALQTHPNLDQVITQSAKYETLKKQFNLGIVDNQNAGIEQNRIRAVLLELIRDLEKEGKANTKVFISHSQRGKGEDLAVTFHQKLKEIGFGVFLDKLDIKPGQDWAATILSELKDADYFILLLSEEANFSEMVIKEVEEARRLKNMYGKPKILPVKVAWPEELHLNGKLRNWLHRLQHVSWQTDQDSAQVLNKVLDVILQKESLELAQPVKKEEVEAFVKGLDGQPSPVAPLEIPRGAVRTDSKYYIERPFEDQFIQRVTDPGSLLRIRGPRQYGKTSLLARVINHARKNGHVVVGMDFQDFSENTLADRESMIWSFCNCIAEELDLEDELEDLWEKNPRKDPKQKARSFVRKVAFPRVDSPILIAMDEADRVFIHKEVSSDFFLMLRGWHEKGKTSQEWESLKMAISYSTEAMLAITDLNASPFNVGEEARIIPFSIEQVIILIERHGLSFQQSQIEQLMELLGGQPYLIRRALYIIASGEYTFEQLMEKAVEHEGPFSDHLRHHLINVRQFEEISAALKDILNSGKCKDSILAERLRASGLVIGTPPLVQPACGLYRNYFKDKL